MEKSKEVLAKELLRLAKKIMEADQKTKRVSAEVDASEDDVAITPEDEKEDEGFIQRVSGIRPQSLKRLNKFRNKKVKALASKYGFSWSPQSVKLTDIIDLLNALISKA